MPDIGELKLSVLKNSVVTKLFVDAADQDYVLARIAHHKDMFGPFFWAAGQAIEKYLKASLLLNGHSSKSYGHDLEKLYGAVGLYAGDLLPKLLTQPHQFGRLSWREETPQRFLGRIEQYVSPHNRYNVFGYSSRWEDLCHLDQLVFAIRRIAFQLDAWPFIGRRDETADVPQTVRELLETSPEYSPRTVSSLLWTLAGEKGDDDVRHWALKLNFPFAPADHDHDRGGVRVGHSFSESVLQTRILGPAEHQHGPEVDASIAALSDWVVDNISLPKGISDQLIDAALRIRGRVE